MIVDRLRPGHTKPRRKKSSDQVAEVVLDDDRAYSPLRHSMPMVLRERMSMRRESVESIELTPGNCRKQND